VVNCVPRDSAACILARMTMVTENLTGVAALKVVGLSFLGLGMYLLPPRALAANVFRMQMLCICKSKVMYGNVNKRFKQKRAVFLVLAHLLFTFHHTSHLALAVGDSRNSRKFCCKFHRGGDKPYLRAIAASLSSSCLLSYCSEYNASVNTASPSPPPLSASLKICSRDVRLALPMAGERSRTARCSQVLVSRASGASTIPRPFAMSCLVVLSVNPVMRPGLRPESVSVLIPDWTPLALSAQAEPPT